MENVNEALTLYAITDRSYLKGRTLADVVSEALDGGITMLQLREKELCEEEFLEEAKQMKTLCREFGVPLIINDNIKVAIRSGADGVHLGQSDLPENLAQIKQQGLMVGITAKTVEQAQKAEEMGADYLGVGALFGSATKKDARAITLEDCKKICKSVNIPAVGIGGVNAENIRELSGLSLSGVAVISALFNKEDVRQAAAELRGLVTQYVRKE